MRRHEETPKDLRRRKLCFTCREPWEPGYRCTAGRAHYIEVFSDSDQEDEVEQDCGGMDGESLIDRGPPPPPP